MQTTDVEQRERSAKELYKGRIRACRWWDCNSKYLGHRWTIHPTKDGKKMCLSCLLERPLDYLNAE